MILIVNIAKTDQINLVRLFVKMKSLYERDKRLEDLYYLNPEEIDSKSD
jgi:hypothetical protein